jgi:(E)-4-hydroxy-3-methylbut-2-enyl-diphosphate synthase
MNNINERRKTKTVKVGSLTIGGGAAVSVQTMWKEPLHSISEHLLSRIRGLVLSGCQMLRFAVPDNETAEVLWSLAGQIEIPLIADIHFDYRLALACLDYPIAKIRINPGNIGAEWKVKEVLTKAKDKAVPIRVGVNSGSLPPQFRKIKDLASAMLATAEQELAIFERYEFHDLVFSLKSTDVEATIKANTLFSEKHPYPLHLGVTEAGPLIPGVVKNTIALKTLFKLGIGDTIRVSLSATPEQEIEAAKAILKSAGLKSGGVEIISCPTCGRTVFPVKDFYDKIRNILTAIEKNLSIAIMGCPVNGPGEARQADLGITGTNKHVIIFKRGQVIRRELIEKALPAFLEELEKINEK